MAVEIEREHDIETPVITISPGVIEYSVTGDGEFSIVKIKPDSRSAKRVEIHLLMHDDEKAHRVVLALQSERAPPQDWRPIEEAPQKGDRTRFFGWHSKYGPCLCRWGDNPRDVIFATTIEYEERGLHDLLPKGNFFWTDTLADFSHFMPLPALSAPPKLEGDG